MTKHALPKGIIASDLVRPAWNSKTKMAQALNGYGQLRFELWYVAGTTVSGWVIPTLLISKSRTTADRTYAVMVSNKSICRVGRGPHVKEQVTVYVKQSRLKALQPYIDMMTAGEEKAHGVRDRISTRRAQTAARRMSYGY